MNEPWRVSHLPEIVAALASRPGHERLRALLAEVMRHAFGAAYLDLDHEVRMPEVHGRADMLFGATVFEFKRDLRQEIQSVLDRLPDYLSDRERQTRRRYLGIATDGASFLAYELRQGVLVEIGRHIVKADQPEAFLAWLEPALSNRDDLPAEPLTVQRELGRDSLTFGRARGVLELLWDRLAAHPEVHLKRQLWDRLLGVVYGDQVGSDSLFLQHTYLTIVAKTIAARVMDVPAVSAYSIMFGQALEEAGIHGAVESDFFDWILQDPEGADLVLRIARQASRFRLRDVRVDVLKALYESLIDPAQRHDLGEYYTPDWLASKLVRRVVTEPLTQKVLDPACGSGTFLFHAIRRLIAAAAEAGWEPARTLAAAAEQVRGLDVHPVAVIIARVTWLLALGELIQHRSGALHVPVFLGDAMQWNVRDLSDGRYVEVPVPDEQPLRIPGSFAEDQTRYEQGLSLLTDGLREDATGMDIRRRLRRLHGVTQADADDMGRTFEQLQTLYRAGRNHIWPFVLRNLVRPLWLSRPDRRADVLIGNPPWVAYRHLSAEMKNNLREACQRMNLWVGGHLSTQQDLCALFWARGAERYLKLGGTIAFVMPYAALNRPAFAGLRRGDYRDVGVRIVEAWSFDETVQPLFPVPGSVLIGTRAPAGALPTSVERYSGVLLRRDASEAEADLALHHAETPWPPIPSLQGASPYRARFKQGATIVPRRFFLADRDLRGRFGPSPIAPRMIGRAGKLDKRPWNEVTPPEGPVELEFIRKILLGESIAPFRLLAVPEGVLPIFGHQVLDSEGARNEGFVHLPRWLREIETKWDSGSNKRVDGKPRMTMLQRLDHMRGLSAQLPTPALRVVYAKAGTLFAACVLAKPKILVDHKAYWASARSMEEALYLCAILNSETARLRIAPMQPKGQGGARDFDNLIWELKIPEYDRRNRLHRELDAAGAKAEAVATQADIDTAAHFTRQRRTIRDALITDGIAGRIDTLVARLLDG